MNNDAIVVSGLGKVFHLPHEKKNTLYESITGIFKHNGHEDFVALKNINFTVGKGEAVGIIGENGSGKSTLLKIITNILRADKGTVEINGKITSFLELGVGFQPDLTVKENVYLYGAVMGMSDRDIDSKIEDILDFSGLKRFEDAKLKNLSSGMQVRIAFATAVQTNPEILLMDEVLAVGDMEFQQKCIDVFQRYIKEKKTIVFVSHDLNSVRKFCNKTLLLRHGKQVAFGDTNDVIDKYVYGANNGAHEENLPVEQEIEEKKENSQSEEGIQEKIECNKTRWGNKKVQITDVKFIDKFGNENTTFISGDQMTIRIFTESSENVDNPVFGLIIYSENDTYCYGTNTEIKKYFIKKLYGKNKIDLIVDKITMFQGKYNLTVAVHSTTCETYDWHNKLYSFVVFNPTEDLGLFSVPCRWELNTE